MIPRAIIVCQLFALFLLSNLAYSQEAPSGELTGKELREWLKSNWYDGYHWEATNERFDDPEYDDLYRNARREMYNFIDNENDKLTGVYSGYQMDFTAGGVDSNPYPLNCEHTVPQSFFRPAGEEDSSEPMRSDIHHLFPTYGSWNSTRNNYPFHDIEDDRTTSWMYLDKSFTVMPDEDIDLYSEFSNLLTSRFEPREDHKGNVARAIFYFYTMYEDNELVYRPIEDVGDIEELIAWHEADPVDDAEIARNDAIADYQGNKNPFVSHPELVARAWSTVLASATPATAPEVTVFPNPADKMVSLRMNKVNSIARLKISTLSGRTVLQTQITAPETSIDVSALSGGVYLLEVSDEVSRETLRLNIL